MRKLVRNPSVPSSTCPEPHNYFADSIVSGIRAVVAETSGPPLTQQNIAGMISKLFRLLGMTDHTESEFDVSGDKETDSNAPDSGLPEDAETAQLVQVLYPELKRLARIHMRRERVDHTLQPTALVSEVFLKLAVRPDVHWRDRSHFLRAATRAMRLLLI